MEEGSTFEGVWCRLPTRLVPPSYPLSIAFYHEKKILLRDFWVGFEVFFRVEKAQKDRN